MPNPTVHVLLHGYPVCMFETSVPAEWPDGHLWVGREELHLATCEKCKLEMAAAKVAKASASC